MPLARMPGSGRDQHRWLAPRRAGARFEMAVSRLERVVTPRSSLRLGGNWLPRVRVALAVWWRAERLDRQLAAGASSSASAVLALRAQRITGRHSRIRLADGLARAIRDAQGTTPGFSAAVRPHRPEVLAARTVLAALDRRLRAPEPVTARGIALLRALLTDGTSPLYRPGEPGALGSQLRAAASALEPHDRGDRSAATPERRHVF